MPVRNFLYNPQYVGMNIVYESNYGYRIKKKINSLTDFDKDFMIRNDFKNVFYIGYHLRNMKHGMGFILEQGKLSCASVFRNGKKNGITYEFQNNRMIFYGEYLLGKRHGFGKVLEIRNDRCHDVYEGFFRNGKYHGKGIAYSNGNIYRGYFHDGYLTGYVKIFQQITGKLVFEGQFVNNHIEGYGISFLFDENNNQYGFYQGLFHLSEWHGQGACQINHCKYVGEFDNGFLIKGKKYVMDSLQYDGEFNKCMEFHGTGQLIQDLHLYIGDFKNGNKHGNGILINLESNETIFEGRFEKNHMKLIPNYQIQTDFEIEKIIEKPNLLENKSSKLKKKHIVKYMKERKIYYTKCHRKQELLEKILHFRWIDKCLSSESKVFYNKISTDTMKQYLQEKYNENISSKIINKETIWQIIQQKKQQENQEEHQYDFFGNEILAPVLANDGHIYDEKSLLELVERDMTPSIHNNIPIQSYETYDQVQSNQEKKALFDNFLKN